jgi:hypothetical protein
MVQCPYTSNDSQLTLKSIRTLQETKTENAQLNSEAIYEMYIEMYQSTLVRWEEDKQKFTQDQIVVLCSLMKKAKESTRIRQAGDIDPAGEIDEAREIDQGGDIDPAGEIDEARQIDQGGDIGEADDIDTTQIFRFLQKCWDIWPNNTNATNINDEDDAHTILNVNMGTEVGS